MKSHKRAHRTKLALVTALLILHPLLTSAQEPFLQDGDFLVGTRNTLEQGTIIRVRNGLATLFCQTQARPTEPGYFDAPTEVVIDPQGRVVFIALLEHIQNRGSLGLWRCDEVGAPPTLLGAFGSSEALGYPRPLGDRPVRYAGGLHLKRTAGLNLNTGTATDKTYYALAVANGNGQHVDAIAYDPDTGAWGSFGLMDDPVQNFNLDYLDMIQGGDGVNSYNISVAQHSIKVVSEPIRVEFDLFGVVTIAAAFQHTDSLSWQTVVDDRTVPTTTPHRCPSLLPGMPRNEYGDSNVFDTASGIAWAADGPVVMVGSHGVGRPYLPNLSMELFNLDPSDDAAMQFIDPFSPTCEIRKKLNFTPWHPLDSWWDANGIFRGVEQLTADGTAGSQYFDGRIISVGPAPNVTVLADARNWPGFAGPSGIDRYPGYLPHRAGLALFVKIESPVNVIITAPDGRRIGIDPLTGEVVNGFGPGGFDSNTDEPHVFGIRNPLPGEYSIEGVGTGTGPFHITAYGVNLETMTVTKKTFAGTAEPGQPTAHGIELTPDGGITAAGGDTEPPTIAGAVNRTVEAAGPLTPVSYDGLSAADESDPAPVLMCAPASGSSFAVGTTSVACTATDASGNTSTATFDVSVVDTIAPAFEAPPNQIVEATSAAGGIATFDAGAATDAVDGTVAVMCAPSTGSTFAIGMSTVTCTAQDRAGNLATRSFSISVRDTIPPAVACTPAIRKHMRGLFQPIGSDAVGPLSLTIGAYSLKSGDLIKLSFTKKKGVVEVGLKRKDGIRRFRVGPADAFILATDGSGNSSTATCAAASKKPHQ